MKALAIVLLSCCPALAQYPTALTVTLPPSTQFECPGNAGGVYVVQRQPPISRYVTRYAAGFTAARCGDVRHITVDYDIAGAITIQVQTRGGSGAGMSTGLGDSAFPLGAASSPLNPWAVHRLRLKRMVPFAHLVSPPAAWHRGQVVTISP